MSDTIRNIGFQSDITVVQTHAPQAIADATPVLSSAVDARTYPRQRCMLIFNNKEASATAHTVAATVTESATSGGEYAASTTSGTLTALSADGIQWASVKINPAKPFLKVTLTGSHADVDALCSTALVFMKDAI